MADIPRYKKILELLDKYDTYMINDLAQTFAVSHMSIRRDLKQLQNLGLVSVSYGGRVTKSFVESKPHLRHQGVT